MGFISKPKQSLTPVPIKMSLQHFFLKDQVLVKDIDLTNNTGFSLSLNSDDLHHAKVLRLKPGEHIGVIDSDNVFYECEILNTADELVVRNCKKISLDASKNIHLWLCPGLSKSNKMDEVIRACTEIGIYGFMPINFSRTVIKLDENKEKKRLDRWKKIAKSAAMQSGQYAIPKIEDVFSVGDIVSRLKNFDAVFICWEESQDLQLITKACNALKENKDVINVAIIVGPEGGITNDEIEELKKCNDNTYVVCIGDSILRTETACISASSIIKFNLIC